MVRWTRPSLRNRTRKIVRRQQERMISPKVGRSISPRTEGLTTITRPLASYGGRGRLRRMLTVAPKQLQQLPQQSLEQRHPSRIPRKEPPQPPPQTPPATTARAPHPLQSTATIVPLLRVRRVSRILCQPGATFLHVKGQLRPNVRPWHKRRPMHLHMIETSRRMPKLLHGGSDLPGWTGHIIHARIPWTQRSVFRACASMHIFRKLSTWSRRTPSSELSPRRVRAKRLGCPLACRWRSKRPFGSPSQLGVQRRYGSGSASTIQS
mmetsp:Transcript_8705/g.16915  ORF Transcript_8705/g.16915 Transcript_8705/m.16915 type:complete len:265 (-) Transcript_8705:2177-2971(-)